MYQHTDTKDDGIDLSEVQISDDGGTVVFLRGTGPNRVGWAANPSANPDGPERSVWAAHTAGGTAWRDGRGDRARAVARGQ